MLSEDRQETADHTNLRERLRHVRWIGGASGAGKSTLATRLAAEHALRLYATDDVMADHGRRSNPEECPLITAFNAMDMDERWVNRSPAVMLETFHWFHGEGFRMIVEDLLSLPSDRLIIAEGFRLLPHLVKPLLSSSRQAIWLLPTPEFRRNVMDRRGWPNQGFLAGAATRRKRWIIYSSATGCLPTGYGKKPDFLRCPPSRSTA